MAQYHMHENLNQNSKTKYPFLLDVQTPLLSDLSTRMVIPLAKKEKIEKAVIGHLNPAILLHKKWYVVLTQQMAAVPGSQIGPAICDCSSARQEILSAIDFLITGI